MDHNSVSRISPEIRLLAVDLDDTLLRDDLTISVRNKRALTAAEDTGVTVLLASGRVRQSMLPYARQLGMLDREGYMISGNGTLLTRSDTGEELTCLRLSVDDAVRAYREIDSAGFPVQVYIGDTAYASRRDPWVDEDCRCSGLRKRVVSRYEQFLHSIEVLKLLIPADPHRIPALQQRLRTRLGDRVNLVTSKPHFLEILPPGADKGSALAHLGDMLSVPRENVMAIGDGMNDVGMIQYAGVGVAIRNAVPDVAERADWVTAGTNEEDGVAEAIERFILQSSPVLCGRS
ncbi:MAG: HAD family phosphatase [Spirochaetaceae bacterium]|nr:MAG: HAD family phosphatase [Spirochaetaceae bacterium]